MSDTTSESSWQSGEIRGLSRTPEDLSDDPVLAHCPRVPFAGSLRPRLGRVTLIALIGDGSTARVYFGVHAHARTEVAVKVLPHALSAIEEDIRKRFIQEAKITAKLRTEHVVQVYDGDKEPESGCYYIVMEYVNGQSAADWQRDQRPRATEADALDICIAATKGLLSAHRAGHVHRDVKPGNIMIPYELTTALCSKAKIADLGLARDPGSDDALTRSRQGLGTPGFLAPEQIADAKHVTPSADVFGMTATLYGLLTGRSPYAGATATESLMRTAAGRYTDPMELRADLSPSTAQLIEHGMRRDPKQRFSDAEALLVALTHCRGLLDAE